ncbi:MAG TPA: hypothetical protein VLE51_00165 [Candidatus Saccharimonadales bacterium]|nr:hypothetical protein [Candidatus Saccharimonadales bacterium]
MPVETDGVAQLIVAEFWLTLFIVTPVMVAAGLAAGLLLLVDGPAAEGEGEGEGVGPGVGEGGGVEVGGGVGDGGGVVELTVTVLEALAVPPLPLQLRLKVEVAFRAPVPVLPLVALVPLQAPLAVQLVAFVVLQLKVLLPPGLTLLGLTVKETVGAGEFMTYDPPLVAVSWFPPPVCLAATVWLLMKDTTAVPESFVAKLIVATRASGLEDVEGGFS